MKIRDRIKELRRVEAKQLKPNAKNWRTHPEQQRNVLKGVLAEIGYADALLARELEDGSLELLDGHLRAETTPDQEVPVLIVDLNDEEASKLLAVLDPIAGLAGTDVDILADLVADMEIESEAVQSMLDEMLTPEENNAFPNLPELGGDVEVPELYQVVVECRDEQEQQAVYERMREEGYVCRLLHL